MKFKSKIPLDSSNYICYNNHVYIIELTDTGSEFHIQYNGVSCNQATLTGKLFKKFKTKNKWFNPNWWYNRTCWARNGIYFDDPNDHNRPKLNIFNLASSLKYEHYFESHARPYHSILKAIFAEVKHKTGLDIKLEINNEEYGLGWHESLIYITLDKYPNRVFVLTWENCD